MGDKLLKKIARELVDSVPVTRPSTGVRKNRCAPGCARPSVECYPLGLPTGQKPAAIKLFMNQAELPARAA